MDEAKVQFENPKESTEIHILSIVSVIVKT